jgi:hypothetical protein
MSVHNIRTEKMQESDVYVGRWPSIRVGPARLLGEQSGYFGNPFVIGQDGSREQVIQKFEDYARARIGYSTEYRERVRALAGRRLFCYCAPEPCHAEVLERLAAELGVSGDPPTTQNAALGEP